MSRYKIYFSNPATQYIQVEIEFDQITQDYTQVKLPKWRPGRYELGNFAKHIKGLLVFNAKTLEPLLVEKTDSHTWEIFTKNVSEINVRYQYYANELNAGSSFLNHQQLYVNPVNCCAYILDQINLPCSLHIAVPSHYKIAIGLNQTDSQIFEADSFHELADAPFIASPQLNTFSVMIRSCRFYFDFMGECEVQVDKLLKDFVPFIERQLDFFGDIPTNMYRFIFQILPVRFYHGVEHRTSTVIALGPGYNLYNGNTYLDLLGVSCHELFHVWNVKSIRPNEMLPYNYTDENYAKTGFVYEGITTYYGDLLLFQSKVFSEAQYFETLEERIMKHFHNEGRFNLSVQDASFDTWLDGYAVGDPGRKTSIYDEGNLIALILDTFIMKHSELQHSLEDVMRALYQSFYKQKMGYDLEDIITLVKQYATKDPQYLFDAIVSGCNNYAPFLNEAFDFLGLEVSIVPSPNLLERYLGFKLSESATESKVVSLADNSPSVHAGMSIGDSILVVNQFSVQGDATHWINYFIMKGVTITLQVKNNGQIKTLNFEAIEGESKLNYFNKYKIMHKNEKPDLSYIKWSMS